MRDYLTCYDYGTGGVWQWIEADTEAQIVERYPALTVFTDAEIPKGLTDEGPPLPRYRLSDPPDAFLTALAAEPTHGRIATKKADTERGT